jgi:hypothetical protein
MVDAPGECNKRIYRVVVSYRTFCLTSALHESGECGFCALGNLERCVEKKLKPESNFVAARVQILLIFYRNLLTLSKIFSLLL